MHTHFFTRLNATFHDRTHHCHSLRRGHGHHGFGHFFRQGGGPEGFGLQDVRAGRKLSGDSLQLLILALLADKPWHGYEIIKELGERSGGFYTPSPGMVYPALTYLEETGHASVAMDGNKKRYAITDTGLAHLAAHRAEADAMLEQLGWLAERMSGMRGYFSRSGGGHDDGDTRDSRRGSPELHAARHALRAAFVARMRDASPEEERRLIEILKRAAAAIQSGEPTG